MFFLAAATGFVSCKRGDQQEEVGTEAVEKVEAAPAAGKVSGGTLNAFFPADEGDWDVIFTQEKEGFSQAKLENGGVELATLSVSDFAGNAGGLGKFEDTAMEIGGLPARANGTKGTVVLAGRFQVGVRSKDEAFSSDDRETWLKKFDLAGLAAFGK